MKKEVNMEEVKNKIEELVGELQADGYTKGVSWKGFDVYIPQYKKPACVGLPYVVLVKGEQVRLSSGDEALEYLRFSQK